MKMNKGNFIKIKVEKLWKWSLSPLLPTDTCGLQQEEVYLILPTDKSLLYHSSRRNIFLLSNSPASEKLLLLSQWEIVTTLNCLLSSNGLSFKVIPPDFPFYFIKEVSFILWTCQWFAEACMSQIAIPVLFINKLIFPP